MTRGAHCATLRHATCQLIFTSNPQTVSFNLPHPPITSPTAYICPIIMSSTDTELRLGSRRTASTTFDGREPKRSKRNDKAPKTVSPSHPNPTFSTRNGADQAMICRLCKAKKVDKAILNVIEHRKKSANIPSRMNLPLEQSCSTCRLLLHARECKSKSYPWVDATYFYRYVKTGTPSAPAERIEAFRLAEPESGPLRFSARQPRKDRIPDATEYRQRMDRLERVDFKLFTEQIRICQERHTRCQLQHPKVVRGLKVIDCRTRNIIQAQPDCAYVALSYVWGSGKGGDLQNPPKTIADALSATLDLGFNYLWIDRYCIDQQDAREKHTQIQQMGTIYRQAQVTIIAAAGADPSHGLPGVSSNRTWRTPIMLNQHVLYPMHQTSQEMISVSTWMSRAWTYQEFVLSRRRLVFTDQHAFLDCPEAMTEELSASWRLTFIPRITLMDRDLRNTLSVAPGYSVWDRFSMNVTRYSKRNLTYASDALNGILGVLSTFEEENPKPVYQLHGLPYIFNRTTAELQLIWCISHTYGKMPGDDFASRRQLTNPGGSGNQPEDFPSWSWTAWEGHPVIYEYDHEMCTGYSIPGEISVELMNSNETISLEDYTHRKISGEDIIASPFIWLTGYTVPVELCLNDFGEGMFVTDSASNEMHLKCTNMAFTGEDFLSGKRPVGNLIALVLDDSIPRKSALLLEEGTHEYYRIGIVSDGIEFLRYACSKTREIKKYPGADRKRIRIG